MVRHNYLWARTRAIDDAEIVRFTNEFARNESRSSMANTLTLSQRSKIDNA